MSWGLGTIYWAFSPTYNGSTLNWLTTDYSLGNQQSLWIFSPYPGVAGAIKCEMIPSADKTIIKARIELHTAMVEVIKYLMGIVVGISGVIMLII